MEKHSNHDIIKVIATFGLLGAAFGFIVGTSAYQFIRSITENFVVPLIGAIFDIDNLQGVYLGINGSRIQVGEVFLSFIDLILVLLVVYVLLFYILKPHVDSITAEKGKTDRKLIDQNNEIIKHLRSIDLASHSSP